ncbi:WD40-repeat-containing domain protein [Mycena floridula]|nr:WD40-repeat-containing domain protein [Mycena floridula]
MDARIDALEVLLKANVSIWTTEDSVDWETQEKSLKADFEFILKGLCSELRNAQENELPNLDKITERVSSICNWAIGECYSASIGLFASVPSFAHQEDTLVKDAEASEPVARAIEENLGRFLEFFNVLAEGTGRVVNKSVIDQFIPPAKPWSTTWRPHPESTLLSRFCHSEAPSWSATTPLATTIYEARCGITSKEIDLPINLHASRSNSCYVMPAMGGYKHRCPILHYFLPGDGKVKTIRVALADVAYDVGTDEDRKLIFTGDHSRIKSYSWEDRRRVHTMDSSSHKGAMIALPNGRLFRAGKGSAAIWNLDTQPTHGETGKTQIGEKIKLDESWRDDPENIERSSGSPFDATITFDDEKWAPNILHLHPSQSNVVLSSSRGRDTKNFSCIAMDLEHSKFVNRYVGHGAEISGYSTDAVTEPNMFATACMDGYARLYDVRQCLPVLTFEAGCKTEDMCTSVALIHPDGIPTLFAGTESGEAIKMFDIRAKAMIYELATGNCAVSGLAWNAEQQTLYSAAHCRYVGRMGDYFDYRKVKKIKESREEDEDEDMEDEDENDEDEDEDEDDEEEDFELRCWPKKSSHDERYFGHVFDAGSNRIFQYKFNDSLGPEPALPTYGNATVDRSNRW